MANVLHYMNQNAKQTRSTALRSSGDGRNESFYLPEGITESRGRGQSKIKRFASYL